jgi:hypothetical protein
VGFVVDKATLEQDFSEYFGFPCQVFHRLLYTDHNLSSSGVGTICHLVASANVGSNPEYYTPSSEPFRICWKRCVSLTESDDGKHLVYVLFNSQEWSWRSLKSGYGDDVEMGDGLKLIL